jgi:hypothetical protein
MGLEVLCWFLGVGLGVYYIDSHYTFFVVCKQ